MSLVERNDMVEALASRGTDQAFAKGIRLWNADRCFQHPKIHGPQCVVHSGREHGIAIMDHEPVRVVAGQDASELLRRPLGGRIFGGIPMQNPTPADFQYQKHIDGPECRRDDHEEIAGQCLAGVIAQKCAPRLRG
jgi:hypothetical protein